MPAGHTWAVQGDVRICDGAVLQDRRWRHPAINAPPSAGLVQAAPGYSADDRQGGQGKRVLILQAPAQSLEPGEFGATARADQAAWWN